MRIFSEKEVDDATRCREDQSGSELLNDNHGQLIIYTGIFKWMDGSYRDEPDPDYSDD